MKQALSVSPQAKLSRILRLLDTAPESEQRVMASYRSNGGVPGRWQPSDMLAMADAITAEEDRLEMLGESTARRRLRELLRDARRALELAGEPSPMPRRRATQVAA